MSDWPFDQPENCSAITSKDIAFDGAPILQVFHDEDDHGWQFLGLGEPVPENTAIICMAGIVKLDPSVKEVAHIEPGWFAWQEQVADKWKIEILEG
ncbi:hypothetical protein EZI54_15310 [Marinobacter halodurans]|uniref:DUF2185 domain-containing protein n=1 Tax=Marinobacter halodurans TaxID=2528979 RepID=A0ABY1ZHT8_9GAMM|nr:hypothetical protein [Marinobacter halodurans]TBW53348.1 hypothetical protein EZI54_15310 [Marinobacter halodurans]